MVIPRSLQVNIREQVDKAKAIYTIADMSGQFFGYAIMLTDNTITPDQIQLLPWQEEGVSHDRLPVKVGKSGWQSLAPASLASDLDISEDSLVDVDSTLEDGKSRFPSESEKNDVAEISEVTSRVNFDTNIQSGEQTNATKRSTSENLDCSPSESCKPVPVSVSSCRSLTQNIAAQIASQLKTDVDVDDCEILTTKITKKQIAKRKSEDPVPTDFSPGTSGRYAAFYTDVGVTQPKVRKYKNHKLVRCLLCEEERILAKSNYGKHLQAYHERPVQCDSCGEEFSCARISVHKKVCLAKTKHVEESRTGDEKSRSRERNNDQENKKVEFQLTSALNEDTSLRVELKNADKIKKAMKKFGKAYSVSRKELTFTMCGVKLKGDELVGELKGRKIVVYGEVYH